MVTGVEQAQAELDLRAMQLFGRPLADLEPAEVLRTALFLAWASRDHFVLHTPDIRRQQLEDFRTVLAEVTT